jgi:hypothetical protein
MTKESDRRIGRQAIKSAFAEEEEEASLKSELTRLNWRFGKGKVVQWNCKKSWRPLRRRLKDRD